jgi:hypothetical protein
MKLESASLPPSSYLGLVFVEMAFDLTEGAIPTDASTTDMYGILLPDL